MPTAWIPKSSPAPGDIRSGLGVLAFNSTGKRPLSISQSAGGALLVGGAVLYLTSPSSRETQVGLTVAPSSSHGGGLFLAGVF